ncbi:tetratricopeptide repeat protein [Aliidiomarina sp. Khilg15.8]
MTFKYVLIAGSVLLGLGLAAPGSVQAQEQEQQAPPPPPIKELIQYDIGFSLPTREEVQKRRDGRGNQAVSERVGRVLMTAFELYEEEQIDQAISELREASPRSDYDRAYIARFMGNLLATNDQTEDAIERLQTAVNLNILNFNDHAASMKLLADLNMQETNHAEAIDRYIEWMQFSGELEADVFIRMASANMELENYEQVIPLARQALVLMDEPNRNPYVLQVAAMYETQQIDRAINVLEEALNILPEEKRWWSQLGMFYLMEEQSEKALATMEIAYLAGFLEQENNFRALIQMYSNEMIPYKAAETMRKHVNEGDVEATPRNLSISASSYHTAREFSRSAEMYSRAIEASDDQEEQLRFHRRRGEALILGSDYAEAAVAFRNAIDLTPRGDSSAGRLYMSLAEALFYSDNYSRAHEAALEAAKFSDQRRNAESWANYIKTTAERRGVNI